MESIIGYLVFALVWAASLAIQYAVGKGLYELFEKGIEALIRLVISLWHKLTSKG